MVFVDFRQPWLARYLFTTENAARFLSLCLSLLLLGVCCFISLTLTSLHFGLVRVGICDIPTVPTYSKINSVAETVLFKMCWNDDDTNVKSARYRPSPFVDARAAGELLQAAKKWGFVYLGISGLGIVPRDIEGGFWIQYERLGFSSLFSSFDIVVEIGGRLTLPQSRLFYACPQHGSGVCFES